MNLRSTCILMACAAIFVVTGACSSVPFSTPDVPASASPTVQSGPTPLPVRTRHAPGEVFDYVAQNGDNLPALAAHFNTSVEEILAENPGLPSGVTTLPPGYPMRIPAYYQPLLGSPFQILPDSEIVNGPTAVGFDVSGEIRQRPGFLAGLSDYAYSKQREAWDVVEVVARNYSVNPRLLLALLEYQTQAMTQPFPSGDDARFPLGYQNPRFPGLFGQLIWVAEEINDGYYGWREGSLRELELTDGLLVRPDPWLNAGTVAVQYVFASLYGQEDFNQVVSPDGFYQTYVSLWGDPFDLQDDFIPANLQQPELTLPFATDRVWDFTAGPHYSWGRALPLGALDFGPPSEESGCISSAEWIVAPAGGMISRSAEAAVVLDLDGDGDERTGWVLFFFHVATDDRIAAGEGVQKGDVLGHPSCEGGEATGTHVHLARRYNGEWIAAAGVIPFVLDGWLAAYGDAPYQGTLTKGSKVVVASEYSSADTRIYYEVPQ
ncbi:MAG: LysM domain-containing protein [Anaerolineales bacterium]